jgi:serine protease Do
LQVYRKKSATADGRTLDLSVLLADRDEGMSVLSGNQRRPQREVQPETESYEAEGLGLTVETLTPRIRQRLNVDGEQQGVVVTDVEFGSPASNRGIQPDMVVIAINDLPIESVSEWRRSLRALDSGSSVKLDILVNQQTTFFFLRLQ